MRPFTKTGVGFYIGDHQKQDAEIHNPILDAGDHDAALAVSRAVAKRLGLADEDTKALLSRAFDESEHPRDSDGKFTDKGGGEGGGKTGGSGGGKEAKSDAEIVTEVAFDVADRMGFAVDRIETSEEKKYFDVGGKTFLTAGSFNPGSGQITLYTNGMDIERAANVVAHEIEHAKYRRVMARFYEEDAAIMVDKHFVGERYKGTFSAAFQKKYPIYSQIRPYVSEHYDALRKSDGVTSYSRSWWKNFEKEQGDVEHARNETLAEIASIKFGKRGGDALKPESIAPIWNQFYDAIDKAYAEIVADDKPRKNR